MSAYLCGPMSGCVNYNYDNFNEAARRLRADGWDIENPAENTPPSDGSWEGYMHIALQQLLTCESVIVLPGWSKSRGASIEIFVARALGKPVYIDDPALADLKPQRTDTIKYRLSQVLDGVVPARFIDWLKK